MEREMNSTFLAAATKISADSTDGDPRGRAQGEAKADARSPLQRIAVIRDAALLHN